MCRFIFIFLLFSLNSFAEEKNSFSKPFETTLNFLPKKTDVSVSISVLGDKTSLFSYQGDKYLVPASNMKLITSYSALKRMGAGYQYKSEIFKKGDDLIISSDGDPYLTSERLWILARSVARLGKKKYKSIKVNQWNFDKFYKGLSNWDESGEPFTAIVSSTSFNFNSYEIHYGKRLSDEKIFAVLGPEESSFCKIENKLKFQSGRSRSIAVNEIRNNTCKLVVEGAIGSSASPGIVYYSNTNPSEYLAYSLYEMLKKEGIEVENPYGGEVFLTEGDLGESLAESKSPQLREILQLLNTYSNNFMTEMVLFSLSGHREKRANYEQSLDLVKGDLDKINQCKDAKIFNGSGLSWDSKLSANCIVEIFQESFRDMRIFADLISGLPIGGEVGSLRSRFRNLSKNFDPSKVRAKTGTLWSKHTISSLSGVTEDKNGRKVIFSLISNYPEPGPGKLQELKRWEEKVIEAIQLHSF
ncbi:MAG: D-alanyl-D-alanine carboxypeptidase/D-alanyl-D-alanine-endopeptidase [Oligoflexia bacterium]|nr:D-alanyl-D-alanine carboxypeptidase/D-alanyl-D-alanine-endopeptidase [Oligoflexia bacterium]